ncbi:helix-turn-helix domain-containing protein [Pseudomonas sp. Env-44]|uniref:helix-turn-helix domain-containing protein n=1 Tax=unclassified Pseudomonas TaxID=196821 RepID=UPI0005197AF6|nr:helix-turn-helix transcriptional regulator [Pseudomonas sp. BRG-100]
MSIGEKLKLIRMREQLTQTEMCEATGIRLETWKGYEYGRRKTAASSELLKVTQHPQFTKYTLWLMTDQTIPEAGQISPV